MFFENGIASAMPFLLYVVLKYVVGTLLPFLQQRAFLNQTLSNLISAFFTVLNKFEQNKKAVTQTTSIGGSIALAFTNDVLCNGFEIKISKAYCFLIPHHRKHSLRTVSTKVRSAIIFS